MVFSKKRNILQIIALILVFSTILSIAHYIIEDTLLHNNSQRVEVYSALNTIDEKEVALTNYLLKSEETLYSLRKSDSFNYFLKSGLNNSTLKELFLFTLSSNRDIMQLRVIDRDGDEKIRIERDSPTSPPEFIDKLQNKRHRYYFTKSESMELNKIWFSAIDLNMESGKIETPFRPTIRAILPIEVDGQFGGIIIINLFMKNLLNSLSTAKLFNVTLYDDGGYFITHYDNKKSWSYYKEDGEKFNIRDDFPEIKESLFTSSPLNFENIVFKKFNKVDIYGGLNIALKLKSLHREEVENDNIEQYIYISILIFLIGALLIPLVLHFFKKILFDLDNLSKLNMRLNDASQIAKIGFWEFEPKSNHIEWSNGVYSIFELDSKSKITYNRFLSYLSPKDINRVNNAFEKSIKEKKDYFISHKIVTEKGNIKYVQERAKHYYSRDGVLLRSVGSIYDITDSYFQSKKYKTLLDLASDGIHIINEDGDIVQFSRSFADTLDYSLDEVSKLNIADIDAHFPTTELKPMINTLIESPKSFETKHRKRGGEIIDVQINAKGIELNGERLLYASQRDITDQKRKESEILRQKNELETIFNTALEGIVLLDLTGKYIKFNQRFLDIMGYKSHQILGKTCYSFTATEDIPKTEEIYKIVQESGSYENFERYCIVKSGEKRRIKSSIALMPNKRELIMTAVDNTELYNAYNLIHRQAHIDELTDLHNRKSYNIDLLKLIEEDRIFSFIILDIDLFKTINDTYGHNIGDKVLIDMSRLISQILEESERLYRIGGEEFVVLLKDTPLKSAILRAAKIREVVKNDLKTIKDRDVTISLGVTESNSDDSVDTIFKRADELLYLAKQRGRDRVES